MNKDTIKANEGSVVVTGKVKGNITTNSKENSHGAHEEQSKSPYRSKIPIWAAIITAIGAIISGALIATSNWFNG
jgi:hypothetical protein